MVYVNGRQITVRTFGWVQDPGRFDNLKRVVGVFYYGSRVHQELVNTIIPTIVEERDGRAKFLDDLTRQPLKLKYDELTGTAFAPRSESRCNGIIQAVVPGQRRPFLVDWSADNFVRWAHALGFISYDYSADSFEIAALGRAYVESVDGSAEEEEILTQALLSYPPVMRILNLLSDGSHLTKFELGRQFGFIGEAGFTTLPQNILLDELSTVTDPQIKNSMKADWDGSSDKYARMICSWLKGLGWVKQESKNFTVNGKIESIGQAYKITNKGLAVRRRGLGVNIATRIPKNVYWEMFSPKGADRVYLRTRRSHILKILSRSSGVVTSLSIKKKLMQRSLDVSEETIQDDIAGFINIGINIQSSPRGHVFRDTIKDFVIPELSVEETQLSDILRYKEDCREKLEYIPHDYLSLIEIAFDGAQNRLFEMQTIALFVNECGFGGRHLGGGRKPDGILYRTEEQHGMIIDTKAYAHGYSLPIRQSDEMIRYIRENISRSAELNPNVWWKNFPNRIEKFNYAFISGVFTKNIATRLQHIALDTGVNGAALNVINMLLLAEQIKAGRISYQEVYDFFGSNAEISI